MEDITEADYKHAKLVCKDFEIKHSGEYHDLYAQSDTSLLVDVFNNFSNICFKTYELDPVHFLSASGIAWQVVLRKIKVKLDLLTDIDMLLIVENSVKCGRNHAIHRCAKP